MDIVELFEKDVVARKRLAELLVGEPGAQLAIINAVLGDAATKSDIERLREGFRSEIARLEERVGGLDKRVDMMFKFTPALNMPILAAVIGILLKMVLAPQPVGRAVA